MDYAELQSAIIAWSNRSDMADQVPGFITLAEGRLNRLLRVEDQVVRKTTTTSTGDAVISLPVDVLALRGIQITYSGHRIPLEHHTPEGLDALYHSNEVGVPQAFTRFGRQIELRPAPSGEYTVEIIYFAALPALSDENTSNWLLENFSDVYLWAGLQMVAEFNRDVSGAQLWAAKLGAAIQEMTAAYENDLMSGGTRAVMAV